MLTFASAAGGSRYNVYRGGDVWWVGTVRFFAGAWSFSPICPTDGVHRERKAFEPTEREREEIGKFILTLAPPVVH